MPASPSVQGTCDHGPKTARPAAPADQVTARPPIEEAPEPTSERTRRVLERRPPADLVMSLTSLFFRHIHPWFPFLDIQWVCIEMSALNDPTLLHYALFGISLPYSFDSRLDQKSCDSYWKYAKRQIFLESLEEPSFNSLEALTVLILDLSGMTTGPQVWGALAIATKLLVQLRNEGSRVFRTSVANSESGSLIRVDRFYRQKLFWAIYTLDCYISITTSRPSCLTESQIESFLPTREIIWQKPTAGEKMSIGLTPNFVCGYQLELLDISRKLHILHLEYAYMRLDDDSLFHWLNQFQKLATELAEWPQALPPCLRLSNRDDRETENIVDLPSIAMLHAYYHALVIHIHGLLSEPSHEALLSDPFGDTRKGSQEICLQSITVLVGIVSDWTTKSCDKLGWPFAWSICIGARYLLVQESRGKSPQPDKFSILLDSLRKMSRYWQISGKYFRILKHAAAELRTGDLSDTRSEQRGILRSLTDLRVATSDLEDQFRVDPMLQYESTAENSILMNSAGEYTPVTDRQNPQQTLPDDNYFNLSFQTSDNWFHAPLFASSAYQQDQGMSPQSW